MLPRLSVVLAVVRGTLCVFSHEAGVGVIEAVCYFAVGIGGIDAGFLPVMFVGCCWLVPADRHSPAGKPYYSYTRYYSPQKA